MALLKDQPRRAFLGAIEALASGRTVEQLLADFPYIEELDIRDALGFAARLAQGHEIRLAS